MFQLCCCGGCNSSTWASVLCIVTEGIDGIPLTESSGVWYSAWAAYPGVSFGTGRFALYCTAGVPHLDWIKQSTGLVLFSCIFTTWDDTGPSFLGVWGGTSGNQGDTVDSIRCYVSFCSCSAAVRLLYLSVTGSPWGNGAFDLLWDGTEYYSTTSFTSGAYTNCKWKLWCNSGVMTLGIWDATGGTLLYTMFTYTLGSGSNVCNTGYFTLSSPGFVAYPGSTGIITS